MRNKIKNTIKDRNKRISKTTKYKRQQKGRKTTSQKKKGRQTISQKTKGRQTTRQKDKKQKGGIIVPRPTDIALQTTNFKRFINNSDFRVLNSGASGIIIIATLKEPYISPYKSSRLKDFGKPCRKLAIKLCVIAGDANIRSICEREAPDLQTMTLDEFEKEVGTQAYIFEMTTDTLQPLTPCDVYHDVIESDNKSFLVPMLNSIEAMDSLGWKGFKKEQCRRMRNLILKKRHGYEINVGIIAMEYVEGYYTLHDVLNDEKIPRHYKNIAYLYSLFIVIQLALLTGQTHGDFHPKNLLVNFGEEYFDFNKTDYTLSNGFLSPLIRKFSGAPMMLDWGYANTIPDLTMSTIRLSVLQGNYISALKLICDAERSDRNKLNRPDWQYTYFGWICNIRDPNSNKNRNKDPKKSTIDNYDIPKTDREINALLGALFAARQRFQDRIVRESSSGFINGNPVPQLPIANEDIDNLFYNYGLVSDRPPESESDYENELSRKSQRLGEPHVTLNNFTPSKPVGRSGIDDKFPSMAVDDDQDGVKDKMTGVKRER